MIESKDLGKLKGIILVLKKRFPNLSTEETLDIAWQIMAAIGEVN